VSKRVLPGVNHATSRREAETDALLRESIRAAGLEGEPLQVRSSPFTADGSAMIGGMFGPPAWAVRLKQLHDGRVQLRVTLEQEWAAHARRLRGRPGDFAKAWRTFVQKLDLTTLNTLIKKHNDYYPIEARLPILYPSGKYYVPAGVEWPQQPVTVEAILEEYPADLDMALFFSGQLKTGT
jgi:hypothetical protein